jgi:5-methylcytosine-specific restriction enzyme subunit McrC
MKQHVLTEYTPLEIELDDATVEVLIARHRRHLGLTPLGRGRWLVTPNSYVGTLTAGGHTFLIKPKVHLQNLLAMMDIAIPSETWRREVAYLDSDPDILAVIARLFCVACEDTTRRGIRRSYVSRAERLVSPRGRIDVSSMIRRPGLPIPVPCRFDDHTPDIPINQILRAASECARRTPSLAPAWRARLGSQLAAFDDVVTPVGSIDWVQRWDPAPMERHYSTAVRLSHLLLSRLSLRNDVGNVASNTFLLNMNDLFEKWVTAQLAKAVGSHRVKEQDRSHLGGDGSILIKPDITIWAGDVCKVVADTKYKLLNDDGTGRTSDYYQALAYATAYGLGDAWLIYARFPGDPEGVDVAIRNTRKRVHTVGLDLTGDIESVVTQIRDLADRMMANTISTVPALHG